MVLASAPSRKLSTWFCTCWDFSLQQEFRRPSLLNLVDKGAYVEVAKGTKLCSNVVLETSRGELDSGLLASDQQHAGQRYADRDRIRS